MLPIVCDESLGLLRGVCETPDDDTPRLAYADWLDEHEQPEPAEFVRVQCEKERLRSVAGGNHEDHPRAEENCVLCAKATALGRREEALWTAENARAWGLGEKWRHTLHARTLPAFYTGSTPVALTRRGFVDTISCLAGTWFDHADRLYWTAACAGKPCRRCGGAAEGSKCRRCHLPVRDEYEHHSGEDYDGTWLCSRLPCCPRCQGTGVEQFPVSAHPVKEVTLTTFPLLYNQPFRTQGGNGDLIYILRRGWRVVPTLATDAERMKVALEAEWPGITFTVPEPGDVRGRA